MIKAADTSFRCESTSGSISESQNVRVSSTDHVLHDLFLARMDRGCPLPRISRNVAATTNESHHRVTPLVLDRDVTGPSLFCHDDFGGLNRQATSLSSDWNPSSLLCQLGQQRMKPSISKPSQSSDPFQFHTSLFPSTHNNNIKTQSAFMTGDSDLDQRIRSFSAALMTNSNRRIGSPGAAMKKKRPFSGARNQATRCRLVGQVVGQKGVQKIVSLVKEIKRLRQQQNEPCLHQSLSSTTTSHSTPLLPKHVKDLVHDTVIVDAWENTPLDDLKGLPWDEILQKAQEHLDAYRVWKDSNSSSKI